MTKTKKNYHAVTVQHYCNILLPTDSPKQYAATSPGRRLHPLHHRSLHLGWLISEPDEENLVYLFSKHRCHPHKPKKHFQQIPFPGSYEKNYMVKKKCWLEKKKVPSLAPAVTPTVGIYSLWSAFLGHIAAKRETENILSRENYMNGRRQKRSSI